MLLFNFVNYVFLFLYYVFLLLCLYRVIKKSLCISWLQYKNNPHKIDEMKVDNTEYIRNVDRAILNMVFENTVRRVNKCLETGGGHFEHYL
jgi:hypothetical protein